MKSYKVALVVDENDYEVIFKDVEAIKAVTPIDVSKKIETPDSVYLCFYWEDIYWDMLVVTPLLEKLEAIRHALITVDEETQVWKDINVSDANGIDEEFSDLLGCEVSILLGFDKDPLDITWLSTPRYGGFVPVSRERALQILHSYVNNDLQAAESWYVYEALSNAGATDKEIEALGFGCCIPETDEEVTP